jgi:hypothetical protein
MLQFRWSSGLFLIIFLSYACGKSLPTLDKIDLVAWKNDKNACSGERTSMSLALQSQSEKLLALSEQEIIDLLGKPDENELFKRNQKFYYYFLEPSKACNLTSRESDPERLVIRFNAIGLAKEVSVE